MMREQPHEAIQKAARPFGNYRVLHHEAVRELAGTIGSVREVELVALGLDVVPERYLRNVGTIGIAGQLKLLRSSVAVVGLGGIGGYVVEALARVGIGHLILIDGDVFEPSNLNRQLLSSEARLGAGKAEVARERIAQLNPAVTTACHARVLTRDNLSELLTGADVVVDALDRLPIRLTLQDGARDLGIPMVHGSIAGFLGQVMTIFPTDRGLHAIYGDAGDLPEQGLERKLGTPPATPMAVAAWEAQEVVKIITGRGKLLRGRLLVADMESATCQVLELS